MYCMKATVFDLTEQQVRVHIIVRLVPDKMQYIIFICTKH